MLGKTLDNRYVIASKLGSGGMARVYLAKDKETGKDVAIKVLHLTPNIAQAAIKRFQREFTICSKFENEHIVKLHSFGHTEDGTPYIALEYIDGQTLGDYLDEKGKLTEKECANLLIPVLSALSAFHEHGVVHRDLKPDNIMLTKDGRVVVMDFGLARDLGVTALTETGAILGTPYYMSPELAEGAGSDHLSDIWQVGILAYEMMTAQKPFEGSDIGAILAQVVYRKPKEAELPQKMGEFIEICLQKDRKDRYQSAEKARRALSTIAKRPSKSLQRTTKKSSVIQSASVAIAAPTSNRRALFSLLFISLLCIFLAIHFTGGKKLSFDVNALRITPELQGFTVNWRSSAPYFSQVNVTSPSEMEVQRVFSGTEGKTREHEVKVTGLKQGHKYALKVIFPDGTLSFPVEKSTKELRFKLSSQMKAKNELLVNLASIPARKLILSTKQGQSRRLYEVEAKGVVLALSGPPIEEMTASAQLPNSVITKKDIAEELKNRVESLVTKLGHFRLDFTLRELAVPHWTAPSHIVKTFTGKGEVTTERRRILDDRTEDSVFYKKCRTVGRTINERLKESKLLADFDEACTLAPLVFYTKLLPFALKMKFHQALNPFVAVYVFSTLADAKSEYLRVPHLGDCRLTLDRPQSMSVGMELHKSKGPKLYIGQPAPFRSITHAKWRKSFDLQRISGFSGAVIAFHLRRIHRMAMKCRVNTTFNCYVYGQPVLYKGEDTEVILYQHVPIEALKQGRNTIELHHETFVNKGLETKASIKTLRFHLLKAR